MNQQNVKILIVDDDETLCNMYAERLKASQYQVETASNGRKGLEMAKDYLPDLILLDIMMPKMDGYEALKELRKDEKTKKIPVILLTALIKDEKKIYEMEKELGETIEYIHKSEVMPGQVVKRVEQKLKSSK